LAFCREAHQEEEVYLPICDQYSVFAQSKTNKVEREALALILDQDW
jgi:hypothetical protein